MTMVPGVVGGGGVGESVLNKGWICASLRLSVGLVVRGRGSSGLLIAGLKFGLLLIGFGVPRSNGNPGLGLRLVVGLAGIVSRIRGGVGEADSTACRD